MPDDTGKLELRLSKEAETLIKHGVRYFGCGGAVGFDTLAALAVLNLRKKFPGVRLIMVLPCHDQDLYWRASDQFRYAEILRNADKIVYVTDKYRPGCMQERNRRLVENSAYCICYLAKSSGGTAYTVDYAAKRGLTVINVN